MTKKTIHLVMLQETPNVRFYELAKALKKHGGFYLTLLGGQKMDTNIYPFDDIFDQVISYFKFLPQMISPEKLSREIKQGKVTMKTLHMRLIDTALKALKPDIVHGLGEPNFVPRAAIEAKVCPVIYDAYDYTGMRFGIDQMSEEEKEDEKICLEHANAFVNKQVEDALGYYKDYGYNIKAPFLYFPEYCDEDQFQPIDLNAKVPKEWHVVYMGVVSPKSLNNWSGHYHDFALNLAKQKIYFTMYASNSTSHNPNFDCFRNIEKETSYFRFHDCIAHRELISKARHEHWGLNLDPNPRIRQKTFYDIATNNKFSDYLSIGLPQIIGKEFKLYKKIIESYPIGIMSHSNIGENLNADLVACNYKKIKHAIHNFRQTYTIQKHISHYIDFTKELI